MSDLTKKQIDAVNKNGLIVLSAGPGSGKTRVVAHRILRIISEKKLLPYQGIAALSFTNVAKDSVLKEYERLTRAPIPSPHFVGTIDSFLNAILFRPFAHKVLNKNREIKIIDVHSTWLNDWYPNLKKYRLNAQNITYDKNETIICHGEKAINSEMKLRMEYVKKDMLKKNIVTQSDVNFLCLKMLKKYPCINKILSKKFPCIIIDEAQDCSDVQMAIVDSMVESGHKEVLLVGDPYQAIFEWRDANPQLFIDKEQDRNWQSLQLLESHRSGPEICRFLNLFHNDRKVMHNPRLEELSDAEVKIIHLHKEEEMLSQYFKQVERKGVGVTLDNVAVLYGGHNSKINLKKTHKKTTEVWKTQDAGKKNVERVFALPLDAKIAKVQKNYKKAYECAEKFFYYLAEGHHLVSIERIKNHYLGSIENRIGLWKFCKQLPSLDMDLDNWIEETNRLIRNTAQALGISNVIELKKKREKKEGQENPNLKKMLFKDASEELLTNNFTLDNIHQIKGRTFDAVMIYVDSGRGNYKLSVRKLKEILQHKDLIDGNNAEDGRCFYVAASRARRLLCIASADNEIETLFEPFR